MTRRLLYLNGLAVIAAALNHAIYRVLPPMLAAINLSVGGRLGLAERLSYPNLVLLQILDLVAVAAVPIFLFVSGFFIAISTSRSEKTISWKIVSKRIINLAIPYLIWSIVFLVWTLYRQEMYSFTGLVRAFLVEGVIEPYYYIPMLFTFLLISPLLVPWARDRWFALLLVCTALLFSLPVLYYLTILFPDSAVYRNLYEVFRIWRTPASTFWFALGIVVGFHQPEFKRLIQRLKLMPLIFAILALVLGTFEIHFLGLMTGRVWIQPQFTFSFQVLSLMLLFTYFYFDTVRLPFNSQLNKLGLLSFGIYLIHYPVQVYFVELIQVYMPRVMEFPLVEVVTLVAIGLVIPVLLYEIVNRTRLRVYSRLIFG